VFDVKEIENINLNQWKAYCTHIHQYYEEWKSIIVWLEFKFSEHTSGFWVWCFRSKIWYLGPIVYLGVAFHDDERGSLSNGKLLLLGGYVEVPINTGRST